MNVPELLKLSGAFWTTCTIHAGVKLDVFSTLTRGSATAAELASALQTDARGMGMLLNALTALELLEKNGETFTITPFSCQYLSKNSPDYMGHIIMHHHYLVEGWSKLDLAVTTGKPVRTSSTYADDKVRESFLMGMFNLAMQLAPHVARETDLNGRKHLLDLAGGPGTYAIHFCKENPSLSAVIFDYPTTRPFAENTVARFDLSDRIAFVAGDITVDAIDAGFDVVWMSHLLHSKGPAACRTIVAKAAQALEAGGMLLVQDFLLDDSRTAPLHSALFSLNMLIGTPEGQAYSQKDITEMMQQAGLHTIHRLAITLPNGAGIMAGTK
ncbi:MAG: methyltransferase domain-containing protein [Desulfobulbaceae bacterium]|nr:methyltransferase domain-containing protein [Desulfobulbaceae bacterium]